MQNCNATRRSDSKHCPLKVLATGGGRAVEITVTALDERSDWISAFAGRAAKRVKRGQVPCRIDLEDGALKVRPAQRRRTVEITVAPLHQRRNRHRTIANNAGERMRHRMPSSG